MQAALCLLFSTTIHNQSAPVCNLGFYYCSRKSHSHKGIPFFTALT